MAMNFLPFLSLSLDIQASLIAHLVKNPPATRETWFDSWVRKIRWRRDRLPTPVFLGFPCGSAGKESACNAGDLDSIPGLGRSPGEGNGNTLQYSCLENSMDRGAWWATTVHGFTKSWTLLSTHRLLCIFIHTHTHTHTHTHLYMVFLSDLTLYIQPLRF